MRRGEGEEVVHDILSAHGPFYYTCMGSLGPRLSPQKMGGGESLGTRLGEWHVATMLADSLQSFH